MIVPSHIGAHGQSAGAGGLSVPNPVGRRDRSIVATVPELELKMASPPYVTLIRCVFVVSKRAVNVAIAGSKFSSPIYFMLSGKAQAKTTPPVPVTTYWRLSSS